MSEMLVEVWKTFVCFTTILFSVELAFCVPNLLRRPHFAARLVVVIPLLCLGLNSHLVTRAFTGTWRLVPFALVVFFASIVALRFLFDASWRLVFFYGSAAYAVEGILYIARNVERYFPMVGTLPASALFALKVALCIAILTFVWLLLVRRYRSGGTPDVDNRYLLVFVGLTLLVTNFLSTWVRTEGAQGMLYAIYSLLCYVLLLALEFDVFQRSALEREREVTRQLERERERQQRASQENVDLINVKCHDLKRQVSALRTLGSSEERDRSIDELERAVMLYDSAVRTGNHAIDTLLTERSLLCQARGVELTCMVDGTALEGMGVVDIYALLGNAVDNAIEAAEKVEEPDGRLVSLRVGRQGSLTYVSVENSCVGSVELEDGLPRTTKGDSRYHGFGLRLIRMIVEMYGGNMTIDASEGFFSLTMLLPLPN